MDGVWILEFACPSLNSGAIPVCLENIFSRYRHFVLNSGNNIDSRFQAVIRMHLAKKGLGLFNDLQNEHSIVGNFPDMWVLGREPISKSSIVNFLI